MTTQLGDLLDEARRRTFVGRRHELATFAASLVDQDIARAFQSLGSLLATPDET